MPDLTNGEWYQLKQDALLDAAQEDVWLRHKDFLDACEGVLTASYAGWSVLDLDYPQRLQTMMNAYSVLIVDYVASMRALIEQYTRRSYLFGYYGNAYLLAQQTDERLTLTPRQNIMPFVYSPWQGSDLNARLEDIRFEFLKRMRSQLIISQDSKETLFQATKRVRDVVGYTYYEESVSEANVRDFVKKLKTKIKRIAHLKGIIARVRTVIDAEIQRARERGTTDVDDDNVDLVNGFLWRVSPYSPDVCPYCLARNGKWFPTQGVQQKPPAHPHCFCSSISKAKHLLDMGTTDIGGIPPRQSYGEWHLKAGTPYDGGLGVIKIRRKRGTMTPPKVDRDMIARVRKSAYDMVRRMQPKKWDTAPRYGNESYSPYRDDTLVEHLSGQHDQKSHGHRGWSSDEPRVALNIDKLESESEKWASGLSAMERDALYAWTGGAGRFGKWKEIKENIREGRIGTTEKNLMAAAERAPVVDTLMYRGIKSERFFGSLEREHDNLRRSVGTIINWKAPVSATVDPGMAAGFGDIVFEIRSKHGRYINAGTKNKDEWEAYIKPRKFRVKKAAMGKIQLDDGFIIERFIVEIEDV